MTAPSFAGPVVAAQALTKQFGPKVVVRQVSFEIPEAAIFGFLGPNGSGKTTVIRMLCGVLRATSGRGTVLGFDTAVQAEHVKRHIGYMSQKFSLYGDLSVVENLDFYARIYGLRRDRVKARKQELLELVGLQNRVAQISATLSGGWKQRLALACALIHEPRVLFLDEPTAGIDPVARRDLWDLLFQLSGRGVTLLVTTHYMDEAERCTQVGYIDSGELIACGRIEDLKRLEAVTPPGTRRVELVCPNAAAALQNLRSSPGVRDATLFGESLHLLIDKDLPDDAITQRIGQDARNAQVRPIPPSLEDVFVTLSRREAARRAS